MLGPIEGLKVLIEVDATKAQAVLREFSGSVAVAGQTAAAGLSPAQKGVNDLLDQIGDTKRRAEELEIAMRSTASGAGAAASGASALGASLSAVVPLMASIVALGIGKALWDAAMSTERMQLATASLKQATTDAKSGLGEMAVEASGLDRELLALSGTIKLVSDALRPKEGEFGADIWEKRSRPLIDWLSSNAPKPVNYSDAPSLFSAQSRSDEAMFQSLQRGVVETRKLTAEQDRLAASVRGVKVELTGVSAALEAWIDAQQRGMGSASLNQMLGLDENGKFPLVESGGFDDLVFGIDAVTEATARLGQIAPLAFMDFTQGVETAAGAAVTLGEYVSGTFEMFEEAMLRGAGTAIYAAISGETSAKKVLKATLNAIGSEAAVQAVMEIAKAIASYAAYDYYAGSLHMKAAAVYGSVAVVAGVASRSINVDSGGGGGGGKGGGRDFKPAPAILPPEREPQITIIIDGNVIGQEEYVRQLALDAAREMKKAGR